jgi:cytochrome c-type biogenesis protein CcmH/NrfF
MVTHMREMVEQGYSDQQILELHPEIKKFFGNNEENNPDIEEG